MNFDELLVNSGRKAILFTHEVAQALSGYPYLFDLIVLSAAFVVGLLVAWVVRMVFVRMATSFYARYETVGALPVRTLVDEPFVNMSRMQEGGCRRYRREFLIDHRSVRLLQQKDLEELRRYDLRFDEKPEAGHGTTADLTFSCRV